MTSPCAHCGATDTNRVYYSALMGWFCVDDGKACDARKLARS